jgi:hypothetical protein
VSGIPKGWSVVPANQVPADWKVVPADQEQAPPQDPELRAQLEAQEAGARGEGELNPANVQPDITPGQTFLEHAGNKAGFGIVPALTGAVTALEMKREGDPRGFGDIYRNAVQGTKQDLSRGEMLNPGAATAGKATGVASTLLLPAGRVGQGLGAAARAGAGYGALYGGIGGLAGGEGLATLNPKQAAADTAAGGSIGAVTGGVLGPATAAVGRGLSPAARYIGGKLQSGANTLALKSVGFIGSGFDKLAGRSGEGLENAASALQREGIVRPFGTVHSNVGRLNAAIEARGADVGRATDTVQSYLDAKLAEQSARLGSGDPMQVLQAGREGIRAPFNTGDLQAGIQGAQGVLEQTPGVAQPAINALNSAAESVGRGGPRDLSLREANALKGRLQDQAAAAGAYGTGIQREGPAAIRSVASTAREHMLETAGQVPGGREAIEGSLERAEPLYAMQREANRRSNMMEGHSQYGHLGGQILGSTLGAIAGGAAGGEGHRREGALTGLAIGLGQKQLRQVGSSLGARAGWAGANALENVAQAGETPVARYIAGLLSGGARHLSPELEGSAGESGDKMLVGGGNTDQRHP